MPSLRKKVRSGHLFKDIFRTTGKRKCVVIAVFHPTKSKLHQKFKRP